MKLGIPGTRTLLALPPLLSLVLSSCELHSVDHMPAPAVVAPKKYSVSVPTVGNSTKRCWWEDFG
ncbi:MAG: hypothetical protein AAF491_11055, partial [Verrucomicrobiota bacterium]